MFNVKTIDETKTLLRKFTQDYGLKTFKIDIDAALGYVSAETVYSQTDVPHFNRSTVDGYAVFHNVVAFASASSIVPLAMRGIVEMGKPCDLLLDNESCVYVPTGGHIPNNATAVVMIENTEVLGEDVLIKKRASKWDNILLKGSDINHGAVVMKPNQVITDRLIGVLKATGVQAVTVFKPLTALVISTGDEITDRLPLKTGRILDINTHTVKHYLHKHHVRVEKTVVIDDNFAVYKETVIEGFKQYDLVIASGGSSVGTHDYTFDIMQSLNAEIFVHGISIKPGKPTIFAMHNNKLFVGLPGQPTSAYIVLHTFFSTIYAGIFRLKDSLPEAYLIAKLTQNVMGSLGRTTVQLVKICNDDEILVTPIHAKSGMIDALSTADGYIIIDADCEGYSEGDSVHVYRWGD